MVLWGADLAFGRFLPDMVAGLLLVLLLAGLSRMLHLDGLADTVDGLFCGGERERMLEVMRDAHVGSFGVVALVGVLTLKAFSLAALGAARGRALLFMPVVGRWAAVYLGARYSYARGTEPGLGRVFAEENGGEALLWGSLLPVLGGILLWGVKGIWLLFSLFATFAGFGYYIDRKLSGVTGDVFGAAIELTEAVFLLFCLFAEG